METRGENLGELSVAVKMVPKRGLAAPR